MFEISFALSLTETGYPRRKARSRRSAFARFTRYSASDIAPAIATAVAPSREKIFWTTLDPTKNPFEARLSAARTTPSLLRMPTVVVMLNLGPLWRRSGKLIRVPETRSHGGGTVARDDGLSKLTWGVRSGLSASSSAAPRRPARVRRRFPRGPPRGTPTRWRPSPPVPRRSVPKSSELGLGIRHSTDPGLRSPSGRSQERGRERSRDDIAGGWRPDTRRPLGVASAPHRSGPGRCPATTGRHT